MQVILEVAIGLVLTIAVVAVVVSSTMELISAVARMRARTLERGIARLLDNQRSEPVRYVGWLGFRKPIASTAATQVVLRHPLIQALSSPRATNRPPSYIDAVTFASAVLGSSLPTSSLLTKVLDDRDELDRKINGPAVKTAWAAQAGRDPTKFVESLLADKDNGRAELALVVDANTAETKSTADIVAALGEPQALDTTINALPGAAPPPAVVAAWATARKDPTTLVETLLADEVNGDAGLAWLVDPAAMDARIDALADKGDVAASVLADAWDGAKAHPDQAAATFIASLQRNDLATRAKQGLKAINDGLAQVKAANPYLGTSLQNLWTRAGSDFTKFRKEVEDWFDREMSRVSGWYSRWAQWIMIAVAFVIVVSLNVSAVTIGKALWTDPTLRTTTADAAQQIVSTSTTTAPTTTTSTTVGTSNASTTNPATPSPTTAPPPTIAPAPPANSQTLQGIGLPIGWNSTAWPGLNWYLGLHLLGIIMVAIAASFGAPFWFDLLNRLVNLRAAGKPPRTAADQRATQSTT